MIIKISSHDIKICRDFAASIDTGFYATRNQFNQEKRVNDQIIGKIGELATFKFFSERDIKVTEPDFKIYGKSKKSWDFDLKSDELNIHVKSQNIEQGKKYGVSWIFQVEDKKIFKEYSNKDTVCFVSVDMPNQQAKIQAILKLDYLHINKLFKLPKLDYLKTNKLAVYLKDLDTSNLLQI